MAHRVHSQQILQRQAHRINPLREDSLSTMRGFLSRPRTSWILAARPFSLLDEADKRMSENRVAGLPTLPRSTTLRKPRDFKELSKRPDDAFDRYASSSFHQVLKQLEADPKFGRKHTSKPVKKASLDQILEYLYSEVPVCALELDIQNSPETLTKQVLLQKERFCKATGIDEPDHEHLCRHMLRLVQLTIKAAAGEALPVLWYKVQEAVTTRSDLLLQLLYATSTFGVSRAHTLPYAHLVGQSLLDQLALMTDELSDQLDTTDLIAILHDSLHKPSEQSMAVRARLFVSQGKADEAEALLPATGMRLRTALPLLRLRIELGQLEKAIELYKRMQEDEPLVHFDSDAYIHVLSGLAEQGAFDKSVIGPDLWNRIVGDMATEIYEIPSSSARRLRESLVKCFPSGTPLLAEEVTIDPTKGNCPASNVSLRLINLEDKQRVKLRKSIFELAQQESKVFMKQHKRWNSKQRNEEKPQVDAASSLKEFLDALARREGTPFSVIVDGANVGYYMQNFDTGRFSFHQIDFVVKALEAQGEWPLVILPFKYSRSSFHISVGNYERRAKGKANLQRLTEEEETIQKRLIRSGQVYTVPFGHLDDFYWIVGSIVEQTRASRGQSLHVPVGNEEGRWPGTRPMLVSNDQMRDHRLGLMEPMLFRRWKSNHIVNYEFSPFIGESNSSENISFNVANVFSREIQHNEANGETVWHFPIQDAFDRWFCCRLPSSS